MIIRPSDDAPAHQMWVAEGHSEEELQKGPSLDYIEYKGIRMKIKSIQNAQTPVDNRLVTKYVWVEMDDDTARRIDTLFMH